MEGWSFPSGSVQGDRGDRVGAERREGSWPIGDRLDPGGPETHVQGVARKRSEPAVGTDGCQAQMSRKSRLAGPPVPLRRFCPHTLPLLDTCCCHLPPCYWCSQLFQHAESAMGSAPVPVGFPRSLCSAAANQPSVKNPTEAAVLRWAGRRGRGKRPCKGPGVSVSLEHWRGHWCSVLLG